MLALAALVFAGSILNMCDAQQNADGMQRPTIMQHMDEEKLLLPPGTTPVILYWYSDNFGWTDNQTRHCHSGPCIVSKTRSLYKADKTRMIYFYGNSFVADDLPLPRSDSQLWALFYEESPKNNWMLSYDAGIRQFNYTATFRRESDYPMTTYWLKDPYRWIKPNHFVTTAEKNRLQRERGFAPLVFVHSHCYAPSDRTAYIKELMKHIKIDSLGSCLNNKEMPKEYAGYAKLQNDGFYKFLAQYKFHVSFENAICQDYMTEKLFRPLDIGVVPVYRGSPLAKDYMPTNTSIIMADDFANPKELADFLIRLNENNDEYDSYLKHMRTGNENPFLLQEMNKRYIAKKPKQSPTEYSSYSAFHEFECYLCDEIYKRNEQIKRHLVDPTHNPMPSAKYANGNHLGCPEPKPSFAGSKGIFNMYNEGYFESIALEKMLHNKESDSSRFMRKYLKRTTEKFPKFPV